MKKLRKKNIIYKILDFIYLVIKLFNFYLVPFPNKFKNNFKKIRRYNLTSFFLIGTFCLLLILYFFSIYPSKDYGIDLASNQRYLNTYHEWSENIEKKVEAYRTKGLPKKYTSSSDYEAWLPGGKTIFQLDIEEITRINEIDSSIRIKGKLSAEFYPDSITSADIDNRPIIIKAKEDILSIADLNFASTEERRFEPIAPTMELGKGWRKSVYRFEGDFPLERDLKKFPFDKAIWRVRVIFPIEPYSIIPGVNTGSFNYSFPKVNSYEPDYMMCDNSQDSKKYINCLNFQLFDRLTYPPDSYENPENTSYEAAQLDYHLVLSVYGRLKRSVSSSFVRYLMPIIFSIMVLSLTDQLSSKESWEIKVATPPTVLLTLIFMQNSYHSQIPQLGYITWLDKLYLLAYLSSILMLINAVISKGDWFNNRKIDIDARLKLNYLIRNIFVFLVLVLPFVTYFI